MSTIACNHAMLAADTRQTCDGLVTRGCKLFLLDKRHDNDPERAIACVGHTSDAYAYIRWVNEGFGPPKLADNFGGLILRSDGVVQMIDNQLTPYPMMNPFHAMGSGRDFAIAGMELGLSPIEAVELAARRDCFTHGPFDAVLLVDGKLTLYAGIDDSAIFMLNLPERFAA